MKLYQNLGLPEGGLISCVGAGGKSSLLMTLSRELAEDRQRFILTSTTKMFFHQVAPSGPVFTADFSRGWGFVEKRLGVKGTAAWFRRWRGIKVDGIPAEWVNLLHQGFRDVRILVEADGARRKLIKAPEDHEPSVPELTDLVLGVLSLKALGRKLDTGTAHRLEKVKKLLNKREGDPIGAEDLARLAGSEEGIFCRSTGRRVLVLTGMDCRDGQLIRGLAGALKRNNRMGIEACLFARGFGERMEAVEVLVL